MLRRITVLVLISFILSGCTVGERLGDAFSVMLDAGAKCNNCWQPVPNNYNALFPNAVDPPPWVIEGMDKDLYKNR